MKAFMLVLSGWMTLTLMSTVHAATWYVALDGDDTAGTNWSSAFTKITNATTRAADFDVVLIATGTYYTTDRIDITSNVICRGFTGNPREVIVDGSKDTRPAGISVFRVYSNAVLEAVTITNGHIHGIAAADGGGVQVHAYGLLTNCIVTGNTAARRGGGIHIVDIHARIAGCVVRGNRAETDGGGISVGHHNAVITDCEISGNTAGANAGGLYAGGNDAMISGCTIISNTAQAGNGGGAWYSGRQGTTWSNNIIAYNNAPVAGWGGGGLYINTSGSEFYNCLFYSNRVDTTQALEAQGGGGGLFLLQSSTVLVYNCTFTDNSANKGGGGIHVRPTASVTLELVNSIVFDNKVDVGVYSNYLFGTDSISVLSNNCSMPVMASGTDGNIAVDPQFVSPETDDFRLAPNSLCVNSGLNMPWMADATDLDGRLRIDRFSGQVDMGCYEYISRGSIYSVK